LAGLFFLMIAKGRSLWIASSIFRDIHRSGSGGINPLESTFQKRNSPGRRAFIAA
jgi:hypothetical protein